MNGEQYDVIVQVAPGDRRTPADIEDIYVRGPDGGMIQLSNLLSIEETVTPKELNRFNQPRAAEITGNLAPGYSLGEALAYLEKPAQEWITARPSHDYGHN